MVVVRLQILVTGTSYACVCGTCLCMCVGLYVHVCVHIIKKYCQDNSSYVTNFTL